MKITLQLFGRFREFSAARAQGKPVDSVTGASIVCRSGATALNPGASADIVITVARPLFDSMGQSPGSCGAGAPAVQLSSRTAGVIRAQKTDTCFNLTFRANKAITPLATNVCLAVWVSVTGH